MITFDFWCPSEDKMTSATADPAGLLFGGTPDLQLTCQSCDTVFRAVVQTLGGTTSVEVKEAIDDAIE